MRFQEYEAKEIFKEFGIPVPEGIVINSDSEIIPAIEKIGIPAILKAQVLVGGRGKAGGIRVVLNLEEAV